LFNNKVNSSSIAVIGGTGRVGSAIVSKLVLKNVETRVLVRDINVAKENKKLDGSVLFQGNVNSIDDMINLTKGCSAVIAVHGVKPVRFFKFRDLFKHPRDDLTHPYNVNYIGTKKIIAAMNINKVNKLVRITGALVGKNPFLPFVALFNFLLSMSVKWHEMSEIDIRNSGLNYTIIRPTGIVDESKINLSKTNFTSTRVHLNLLQADDDKLKFKVPSQILVNDLTDLCIIALHDARLSCATVIATSTLNDKKNVVNDKVNENPYNSWNELIAINKVSINNICIKYFFF
jgi:nucleoside-diphosphate-sugar epimerase